MVLNTFARCVSFDLVENRIANTMDALGRFKKIIDRGPTLTGVVHTTTPTIENRHFAFRYLEILFVSIGILFHVSLLYTIFWRDGELALRALSVFGTSLKVCEFFVWNNNISLICVQFDYSIDVDENHISAQCRPENTRFFRNSVKNLWTQPKFDP